MNKDKLTPELRFPEFKNEGEWDLKEFSKFIKLDRGSSPRPIQEYLTKDETGVNWIKIGDTKNALNSVLYQVEEKITLKGAEKSRRVGKGELILANSMSFGKTYELAIEGCIYDGWFVLRKYEKHFFKPFLLQLLNSDFMQNQYKKLSAGGIVQNINSDIVYNSKLFHTSLLEQQKIASCLSSLDEVISAHSQKLELLKDHKKSLMQNLFPQEGETVPKYRFKEFVKDGAWEEKIFDEILDITRLAGYEYSEYWKEDIKKEIIALRGYNIGKGTLLLHNLGYISYELSLQLNRSKLYKGDIVYPCVGTIGNAVVIEEDNKFHIQQNIAKLTPKKDVSPYFISQFLMSHLGLIEVNKFNATSSQPNVLVGSLRNFKISIPRITEQQKIASCLSSLDALINAQTEKIVQLKLHKKGLMQGLFPIIQD